MSVTEITTDPPGVGIVGGRGKSAGQVAAMVGELLQGVDCAIVAAGMDGALASVVVGLIACPVIALPTSIGYGTAFGGVAALVAWRILRACGSRRSGRMP